MTRVLTIVGREGRFDVPLFTLSDNESLFIKVNAPRINRGVYYFVARHGEFLMNFRLGNSITVELTSTHLKKGGGEPLISTLEWRDETGTVVYKKYNIEPLEIQQKEVGLECYAAVQKIEIENMKIYAMMEEFKGELAKLTKRVEGYEQNGIELVPDENEKGE